MAFSRPFCLGFTQKTGEAVETQRDAEETAKKSDGAKTRSWAGATLLLGAFSRPTLRGVAPAHRRWIQRRMFWPRCHRKRGEKGTRREEGKKQVPSDSEQPVILKRKVRLEQSANELLEDYAQFIGISAEDVLNVVLRKIMANDADFHGWMSRQGGQIPLGLLSSEAGIEAA